MCHPSPWKLKVKGRAEVLNPLRLKKEKDCTDGLDGFKKTVQQVHILFCLF